VDSEHTPELARLRTDAERLIAEGRWLLRLFTHASLGGMGAVGIMDTAEGQSVVLRMWDLKADSERLGTLEGQMKLPRQLKPTIHERQVPTDPEQSRRLIAQLAALPIPVLPPASQVSPDGVLYEIHGELGEHSATLRWVNAAPKGWETLGVWFTAAWSGLSHGFGVAPDEPEL
jgi:hypothetical protein